MPSISLNFIIYLITFWIIFIIFSNRNPEEQKLLLSVQTKLAGFLVIHYA